MTTTTLEQAVINNPSMTKEQLSEFYLTEAEAAHMETAEYREEMKEEAEKESEIQEMLFSQDD
jgi:hypothetical protein